MQLRCLKQLFSVGYNKVIMSTKKQHERNEDGIVAILVTMIIMIVLSLIVTGFAQLARRQQREALDNQLNTQAFYAAESGINDARRAVKAGFVGNKTTCDPLTGTGPGIAELSDNKVSVDGVIQYSCLLINRDLESVPVFVGDNDSTTIPMSGFNTSGVSVLVDSMTFEWVATGVPGPVQLPDSSSPDLPTQTGWGGSSKIGMLRIDIIPTDAGLDPTTLASGMTTFFGYPTNSGGSSTAADANGKVVNANCSSSTSCKLTITGLSSSSYYVRFKSIYNSVTATTCFNLCNGTTRIRGAGIEIDSTGKANDVLKRIKVLVADPDSTSNKQYMPEFPVDSKSAICKLLQVRPGNAVGLTDCGI